jgi:hypothetical protein
MPWVLRAPAGWQVTKLAGDTPRIRAPGIHRVLAMLGHIGQTEPGGTGETPTRLLEKTENAYPWSGVPGRADTALGHIYKVLGANFTRQRSGYT